MTCPEPDSFPSLFGIIHASYEEIIPKEDRACKWGVNLLVHCAYVLKGLVFATAMAPSTPWGRDSSCLQGLLISILVGVCEDETIIFFLYSSFSCDWFVGIHVICDIFFVLSIW